MRYVDLYKQIPDSEPVSKLPDAIALAQKLLGNPAIPICKVHLCYSEPSDPASKLRRGFQLCELVDESSGEFAIYLSRRFGDPLFWGQYAHEVAHLLNAKLYDAYIEGLNNVYAGKFCTKNRYEWKKWHKHFMSGAEPFYSISYRLMTQVEQKLGSGCFSDFLKYAVNSHDNKMVIDVNSWIGSLPNDQRQIAQALFKQYHPKILPYLTGDYRHTIAVV